MGERQENNKEREDMKSKRKRKKEDNGIMGDKVWKERKEIKFFKVIFT